jgi:hypothetical protein
MSSGIVWNPPWKQRVRVGVVVGVGVVGIAVRLGAESSMQSLGGQFCAHTATVDRSTAAATPPRSLLRPAVD